MTLSRNTRRAFVIAIAIFILDQLVKWWVIGPMNLEAIRQVEVLPFFNFTWVENRGISFGLFTAGSEAARWLLTGITAIIATGVAIWITREKQWGDQAALSLVLGGALGNIVDRARFGYVVDYADLHFGDFRPFLVFNIADAAISIGIVILLLRAFFVKPPEEKKNA
ncbi:signal peptidase II [Sphingomicrobium clamense]|uniref:Lipoprotein signal peptidase n=1 Tax=Sphingomicrobium clamense TaxID=2851013 RepID=A0ABS6V484_9SPHN|nr:signal peptidase II [Sphingomicrobium sp. B8]MBW0144349.1 signal peptidase II [Sphingomicrobium sp. B8]